mgnify:CR=1 FL=1
MDGLGRVVAIEYLTAARALDLHGERYEVRYEPAEAADKEYFRLGAMEVSPDGRLAATLVDDNGSERFKLRIRDLATGKDLETVTEVGIGRPAWTADSKSVVFTEVNDNWRSYRARFHRLGTPNEQDITLYEDRDVLILNKPLGLAVQGGSGTTRHLDGMLEVLRQPGPDGQRPRLVHRGHRARHDGEHRAVLRQSPAAQQRRVGERRLLRHAGHELEHDRLAHPRREEEHLPVAADAARVGLHDAERERHGHRRVHDG